MPNPKVLLINRRLFGLFAFTVVCILLVITCAAVSYDPNTHMSLDESGADSNDVTNDSNGPTIFMDYSEENPKINPIYSFAYFIPLISPTLVDREISVNNNQQVSIISYKKKVTSKSFYAACEFKMTGKGFHRNTFDSAGMIARNVGDLKEGEPLTNMLDYIKFQGQGVGLIEVKGTITGSTKTVTEVDICFHAKGELSPVTIGLYSVKPQNGQYKYENRYNEIIATVDTLTFSRSSENPRMGIEISSIRDKNEEEVGFWSKVKAIIANFFIKPLEVDKLGNDTMLNFGYAILKQEPAFTFPIAKNIKEDRVVTIGNIGK
jgi:hypothetical protein